MSIRPDSTACPADEAAAVTPSNTARIGPTRGLYVGVTGNVTVDMETTGTDILFTAVPAGATLPISVIRVKATGTTATGIVALY